MTVRWFHRAALVAALTLPGLASASAETLVPLREEPHVNRQLLAGYIGDRLRKTCPDASARLMVVLGRLQGLKGYAREKGYPDAEMDAFLDDPAEKKRLKAEAAAYLAQAGAVQGDAESYCRVARDEVARNTLVGQLIRVRE